MPCASAQDTACWPRVWAERGLWMLTGTFVARVLWSLQDTVGAAMCLLLSGLFLNGQVAGLLTLTLQALALWALTAHLWRRVTGGDSSYSRLGRLILTHPALTMLGFFCANYALRSLAIWSGTAFSPALSALFAAQGNTFIHWYQGNHELWYNIIPVVLLVWLARGRWRENLIEPCQPE